MAHVHTHDRSAYYVEQLCTIGIGGALGGIAIMLWARGLLFLILAPKFHLWVLLGGIALLVLVAVRAVTVWLNVGQTDHAQDHHHHDHDHVDCGHDHEHCDHDHAHAVPAQPHHHHAHSTGSKHEHPLTTEPPALTALPQPGHEHHHHDHSHDHAHDHGWAPWRYVILLLPIVLYFLNLPNEGFSMLHSGRVIDPTALDDGPGQPTRDQGADFNVGFLELERAAYSPQQRMDYEGKTVRIKGQFRPSPISARKFTLIRYKINCCAADAIPLNVVIESPEELEIATLQNQWVEVTGQVVFRKLRGKEEYVTALVLKDKDQRKPGEDVIKKVPPDLNPYIY
jgi:uncharacterized repeat protein (TIGR03943 family)